MSEGEVELLVVEPEEPDDYERANVGDIYALYHGDRYMCSYMGKVIAEQMFGVYNRMYPGQVEMVGPFKLVENAE